MTNQERLALYDNGVFRQMISIKLLDWAGYWTTAGISGITDPLLKEQTRRAIDMVVQDLGYVTKVVASLAISDSAIVQAVGEVPETLVDSVVDSIMSSKLAWVTGIVELV